MDTLNIIIGCILVTFAVAVLLTLTISAHRGINRIARDGCRTARETLKEFKRGK